VRQNTSSTTMISVGRLPGGRYTATNMPLRQLIQNAYGIRDFQLEGGPSWISNRYDIVAKADQDFSQNVQFLRVLLQNLLAERFKLAAHMETREMPIYAMVLARADGRLGPQLRSSNVDCDEVIRMKQKVSEGVCGMRMSSGQLVVGAMTLNVLTSNLSSLTKRVVEDRTGLTGRFDYSLDWARSDSADTSKPSIFTALQEQLGLKLESTRGPVEVLVVDRVEPPTPD
jgi:uncharacterized protein (TIGR03435 family)